jgi:hypothetical protein
MIDTSKNGWYSWAYGDGPNFGNSCIDKTFTTRFRSYHGSVLSFAEELKIAARDALDHYPGLKPVILFSGGSESEVMLRSFLSIGVIPEIHIVRYENDYNLYDVSYAVTICNMLGVPYKLIDFNLQKFYENDSAYYSDIAEIDRPRALPYCKFLEMTEGLVLMGNGDVTIYRTDSNYGHQGTWKIRCWEHDIGWNKFVRKINKPAIPEWFKWTPGLVLSSLNLNWVRQLTSDQYIGKLGVVSTKLIGYREVFPNLIDRTKQTGFEKINHLVEEVEEFLIKKNNGLKYRGYVDREINEFKKEINTGTKNATF